MVVTNSSYDTSPSPSMSIACIICRISSIVTYVTSMRNRIRAL
jgi:hypothetical protein